MCNGNKSFLTNGHGTYPVLFLPGIRIAVEKSVVLFVSRKCGCGSREPFDIRVCTHLFILLAVGANG